MKSKKLQLNKTIGTKLNVSELADLEKKRILGGKGASLRMTPPSYGCTNDPEFCASTKPGENCPPTDPRPIE